MKRNCLSRNSLLTMTLMKKMSTSSKPGPTHYQSLEVNPEATQKEIKSAYFKLSMRYHPDKNQSDEAKDKFQKISTAYEVLGDHSKRRAYDRGLSLKTANDIVYDNTGADEPIDIVKETERIQKEMIRREKKRKKFDFDTWTQAHYGQTFDRQKEELKKKEIFKKFHLEQKHAAKAQSEASIVTIFFVLVLVYTMFQMKIYDDPQKHDQVKTYKSNKT